MSKHAMKHVQYKVDGDLARGQRSAHELHLNPDAIAIRAYELWRRRGCPDGSPEADWFEAERELSRRRSGSLVG